MMEPLEPRAHLTAVTVYSNINGGEFKLPGVRVIWSSNDRRLTQDQPVVSAAIYSIPIARTHIEAGYRLYPAFSMHGLDDVDQLKVRFGQTLFYDGDVLTKPGYESGATEPLQAGGSANFFRFAAAQLEAPGFNGHPYGDAFLELEASLVIHTANLQADGAGVAVDSDQEIQVTVTDDWGNSVVGKTVTAAVDYTRLPTEESVGVGVLELPQTQATTDANGVAKFTIKGMKTGSVPLKFTCPQVGGETRANYTVSPLYQTKRYAITPSKAVNLAGNAWDALKVGMDATELGRTLQDWVTQSGNNTPFSDDQLNGTIGDYMQSQLAAELLKQFSTQLADYKDMTVKTGWKPEHFNNVGLPALYPNGPLAISILGIGGSVSLSLNPQTLTLDPDKTWKSFTLDATIDLTVDPTVFGFKAKSNIKLAFDLGVEKLNASGGTAYTE